MGIEIAQLVVIGLIVGSILALGAVGLTLVYGVLGVADFAHGDKLTVGMFVAFFVVSAEGAGLGFAGGRFGPLSFGWGLVVGLLLAMVAVALLSAAGERWIYRRLRDQGGSFFAWSIASLGLAIAIRAVIQMVWGSGNERYTPGIFKAIEVVEGIRIKPDQFFIFGMAVLCVVVLWVVLYRTKAGKAMRATADNPELAEACGIRVDRVRLGTWLLAGALCAIAGVMLGVQADVRFDAGFRLLLPMFAAVIIGGLGNPWGALAGGFIVGISQEVSTQWIPTGLKPAVPFVLAIFMLLVRPRGLFGQER